MSGYSPGHPTAAGCLPSIGAHRKGLDSRPGQKGEAHGGHTCRGWPALWVLNHSNPGVLHPLRFPQLLSALPFSAVHSADPGRPALPSPGLGGPIKANGQRPACTCCGLSAHFKTLLLLARRQKRGRPQVHWLPEAPHTKGRVTKTFSGMAGVGVGFHPEYRGRRKASLGFPGGQAAQTRRAEPLWRRAGGRNLWASQR